MPPPPTPDQSPEVITDLLTMTFGEVLDRFGAAPALTEWLDTRKLIGEVARNESRLARDAGRLISRELVRSHVLGLIEEVFRRLLADAAVTIAARAHSEVRSGATREELVGLIRSAMSTEMRTAKTRAARALNACRTGDNPPEVHDDDPKHTGDVYGARLSSLRAELARCLSAAAPRIVDATAKNIARAAVGQSWAQTTFDDAMSLSKSVEEDSIRMVRTMISAAASDTFAVESIDQDTDV